MYNKFCTNLSTITLPVRNNVHTSFSYRLQCMQKPTPTLTQQWLTMVKLMPFKAKNCAYELH